MPISHHPHQGTAPHTKRNAIGRAAGEDTVQAQTSEGVPSSVVGENLAPAVGETLTVAVEGMHSVRDELALGALLEETRLGTYLLDRALTD
ncbi:hypothetical protein U1Q18_011003 [Sarracenia purpurea var. burkii]